MILQALVKHYEDLEKRGIVPVLGWSQAKVSHAIYLNENGEITQIVSVMEERKNGNKTILVPKIMNVPEQVKRSVGILPNFLCDKADYMLGIAEDNKKSRAIECFRASSNLHKDILKTTNHKSAKALVKFFSNWNPENADNCQIVYEKKNELLKGGNIVFRFGGKYLQDIDEIRTTWNNFKKNVDYDKSSICLVTGKRLPVARLHPSIKGIKGAQSAGASLVSFNGEAFSSYGWEQGENAPTSEYAAFAYGTALNHLIEDREHNWYLGDTLVLCWAEGADSQYQDAFGYFAFGDSCSYTDQDIQAIMGQLCKGQKVNFNAALLDPNRNFYILGISPNAARLSVRFFYHNSFGKMMQNIENHHTRMQIIKPSFDKYGTVPVWALMKETTNQHSKNVQMDNNLAGDIIRAIISDGRYPATMLNEIEMRIRAEHDINRIKASAIKAYYSKNININVPKEVLTVALNTESSNIPYNLGRLFAVLEEIQQKSNPGINATIKDKYFNSASSTPGTVFPILINLAQKHIRKLEAGQQIYCSKKLGEIMDKLGDEFPTRLNLPQQGAFQLGYYHQNQNRFQANAKKEEN